MTCIENRVYSLRNCGMTLSGRSYISCITCSILAAAALSFLQLAGKQVKSKDMLYSDG